MQNIADNDGISMRSEAIDVNSIRKIEVNQIPIYHDHLLDEVMN